MKTYTTYNGNLRTINFTIEELNTLILVSEYSRRFNYSIKSVYYAIHNGYLPAKKIRGKYRVLPILSTSRRLVR
jgi:hypothetical protein